MRLVPSVLAVALGAAAGVPARAEPRALTLPEALAYAGLHQPSLVAARARLEAARREAEIPRGLWFPRVGATVQALAGTANNSTASTFSTSAVDLPRIGGTRAAPPVAWDPHASTLAGVGLRQELFDFGRIGALEEVYDGRAGRVGARRGPGARRRAARGGVLSRRPRRPRGAAGRAGRGGARARVHREQAAAGVHSGLRSPIELTRAEADLSRFEVGRVRAQGGLDIARALFAAAVGVPEPALDAAGAPPAPRPAPSEGAIAAASERAPEVRAAQALLLQQQGVTHLARSELAPSLQLTAGLNARAGGAAPSSGQVPVGDGWVPAVPNWDVGVILAWPLFDASSLARVSASREREAQRAAEEGLTRQSLRGGAATAAESFRVTTLALPSLARSVEAAQANHAQAEARFKAGLGSSVELADAEALRLQAEIDLAVGRFEQARARARLSRALAEAP